MDKHFAFGIFSILAMIVLWLFVSTIVWDTDSKGEIQIEERLFSPNKHYVATLGNEVGGGAAGWCFRYISVGEKNNSKVSVESDERVFKLDCGSEVRLNWVADSQLNIKYRLVEKYSETFFQKYSLENGEVEIKYIKER